MRGVLPGTKTRARLKARKNRRVDADADRFVQLCSSVAGKRLTWDQLTCKDNPDRPDRDEASERILGSDPLM